MIAFGYKLCRKFASCG